MKKPILITVMSAVLLLGLIAIWLTGGHSANRSSQESFDAAVHSALTNPVAFAKDRVTGGVGVMLTTDKATGSPLIVSVMPGSPAEKAGLRGQDLILTVNGIDTRGRTLAQNIEDIRGFAAGNVVLRIQRNGSTKREVTIHRSSWNSIGVKGP